MKRFLKKRWHSIPVGIITAVLMLGLVAGGVFAAYDFFTATAGVTVEEALFAQVDPSCDWDDATSTFTFSNPKVGETTGGLLWLSNSSSRDIPITLIFTQLTGPEVVQDAKGEWAGGETYSWIGFFPPASNGNYNPVSCVVPAGAAGDYPVGFGFYAGISSASGIYTFTLDIER